MSSQPSSLAVIVWLVAYSEAESFPRSRRASRRCRRGRATKHHPRRRARGEAFSSTRVKINMAGFKPVEFKSVRLSLKSGGHLNKETVLTTKDIGTVTFIRVKSRDAWLQAATMGKTTRGETFQKASARKRLLPGPSLPYNDG